MAGCTADRQLSLYITPNIDVRCDYTRAPPHYTRIEAVGVKHYRQLDLVCEVRRASRGHLHSTAIACMLHVAVPSTVTRDVNRTIMHAAVSLVI